MSQKLENIIKIIPIQQFIKIKHSNSNKIFLKLIKEYFIKLIYRLVI